jgi:hypothetical protein
MQPHTVVDLIVKDDARLEWPLNRNSGEQTLEALCRGTVLASGGLAGIYGHSTNPAGSNALGFRVYSQRLSWGGKSKTWNMFNSIRLPCACRVSTISADRGI